MKFTAKRNMSSYDLTAHRENSPVPVNFDKGEYRNLRDQSPFKEGTRNKDWVNPTLSSNVLFYNHNNEDMSRREMQQRRLNKKGYDLNHYVGYDIQVRGGDVGGRHTADERAEKSGPVHHQKEVREVHVEHGRTMTDISGLKRDRQLQNGSRSPVSSTQRINVDRSRSPMGSQRHVENGMHRSQQVSDSHRLQSTGQTHQKVVQTEQQIGDYHRLQCTGHGQTKQRVVQTEQQIGDSHRLQSTGQTNQRVVQTEQQSDDCHRLQSSGNGQSNHRVVQTEHQMTHSDSAHGGVVEGQQLQHARAESASSQQAIRTGQSEAVSVDVQGEQGVKRSSSAVGVSGQRLEYLRATSSNVSNPDNLVCDYCVNKDMADAKARHAQALQQRDTAQERLAHDELRRQLEEEKRQQFEKIRAYKDGIDAQRGEQVRRLRKDTELRVAEQKQTRAVLEEGERQDWERAVRREEARQRYAQELSGQVQLNHEARRRRHVDQVDADRQNKNLLIDDSGRAVHRLNVNEGHKRVIREQMEDQVKVKEGRKEEARAENEEYRRKVQEMITKDVEERKRLAAMQRQAYLGDIQRQNDMKAQARLNGWELEQAELENLRQRANQDRQRESDLAQLKRQQLREHARELGHQMVSKSAEKQAQLVTDRAVVGTTLLMHPKSDKCYNCAKCRNRYPLKMLNKNKRVSLIKR